MTMYSLLDTIRLLEEEANLSADDFMEEEPDEIDGEPSVEDFLSQLNADDVGVSDVGPYRVHYEGFSDWCQQDAQDRCHLPPEDPRHLSSYESIYDEVLQDFVNRESGEYPIDYGLVGDEQYPVFYAVFNKGGVDESAGIPSPGSYEQEYNMFKTKGQQRNRTLTNEDERRLNNQII